jgi:gliding motility-associated-like protein
MKNKSLLFRNKRVLLFLLFAVIGIQTNAQIFDWLITGGGPLSDKATSIAVDANGNTFITGYFNEEGTFGPFYLPMIDLHSKEVFVAKIDPAGNYLWVKRGSNHYDDRGLGLCLDPVGNVYVTGTCWGGLIFGTLNVYNTTSYTDQIYVLKLDTDGNEIWLKNAGVDEAGFPYNDDHGFDLVSDSDGDILVTGFISNNDPTDHFANFDAISIPVQAMDSMAFIAKLSNDGVWQWVQTNGGVDGYRDNRITVDDEKNIYVVGGFQGTKTFGTTTLTSAGLSDIYITKYDTDGNFMYAKNAGSPLDDRANDVAFDYENNLYITGEFKGNAVFGTDTINNNGSDEDRDIFVARISKDGIWDWVKKAGSNSGGDRGNGIVVNHTGNIFVTGQFKDKAKFGGTLEVDGGTDSVQVFIAAIDSLGKWRWVIQGGGIDSDRGNGITCDEDCHVYATGYYASTIFFDTNTITSTGKKDMFILKMKKTCFGYDLEEPDQIVDDFSPVNVFSPNGDGINDQLIFFKNYKAVGKINILNRWGNVVYESSDLSKSWDGKDQHNAMSSDGVYFYSLEYTSTNGELKKHAGFISLFH